MLMGNTVRTLKQWIESEWDVTRELDISQWEMTLAKEQSYPQNRKSIDANEQQPNFNPNVT